MDDIKFNTIEEAIEDFKNGKFLIVVDDEDRENEGDKHTSPTCSYANVLAPEVCKYKPTDSEYV